MAQQTTVRLIDDVDGSEAKETVSFALDGKQYEIDLSTPNANRLRKALTPFLAAARKAGGRSAAPRTATPRVRTTEHYQHVQAVRDWAKVNGFNVSDRGRIPALVTEAYEMRDKVDSPAKAEQMGMAVAATAKRDPAELRAEQAAIHAAAQAKAEVKSNVTELRPKPATDPFTPADALDLDKVMAWWRENNPKSNAGRPTERIQRLYREAHQPKAQQA